MVVKVQNKKNFWYILPGKKRNFHTEICIFSSVQGVAQKHFWNTLLPRKKGIFLLQFAFSSSGQGVVQIEPSSVWTITIVVKVQKKRIFGTFCLGKKGIFHTEICEFRD